MAVVLITGNPGAGKTELARELSARGYAAIDADDIAGWETQPGAPAAIPPVPMTAEWLAAHRWVWQRAPLDTLIAQHTERQHLFLCGIALNQFELLHMFDVVFLLSLDEPTQLERLDTPSNADRNAAQRAEILNGRPVFERQMREARAVVLDARKPTAVLADEVLAEVAAPMP